MGGRGARSGISRSYRMKIWGRNIEVQRESISFATFRPGADGVTWEMAVDFGGDIAGAIIEKRSSGYTARTWVNNPQSAKAVNSTFEPYSSLNEAEKAARTALREHISEESRRKSQRLRGY